MVKRRLSHARQYAVLGNEKIQSEIRSKHARRERVLHSYHNLIFDLSNSWRHPRGVLRFFTFSP